MTAKLLFAALALLISLSASAAEIIVVNGDPPGVGFNNPTPATPIGGNPGTTVGQQALNVFQEAADVWGAKLLSDQPIFVIAFFTPLPCTATSAVLGAAGPNWFFANIPAARGARGMAPDTWYPAALAEKLTRQDIVADPTDTFEVYSLFNSNLGQTGCLTGNGWYYGLDHAEPGNRIDLLAVVLHEFGHGLGFLASPTSAGTGARAAGFPSIWEGFMLDVSTGKRWLNMTDAERAASARNNNNLVWVGQKGSNGVHSVLDPRTEVIGLDPSSIGVNEAQAAFFGPPLRGHNQGRVIAPADGGGVSPLDGCEAFPPTPSLVNSIVLVDRGICTFTQKVLNAQNAGAAAVIIANNVAVGLPTMTGVDPTIVIPSVGVTQALGALLRATPQALVDLRPNHVVAAGTVQNNPRLYAPPVFSGGSSVSHWDTSATPNLLMEPFINTDLTSGVKNPDDLTKNLLRDIGW